MSEDDSAEREDDWFEQGLRESEGADDWNDDVETAGESDETDDWEDWGEKSESAADEWDDWDDDSEAEVTDSAGERGDPTSDRERGSSWADSVEKGDSEPQEAEVANWTQEVNQGGDGDSLEEEFAVGGEGSGSFGEFGGDDTGNGAASSTQGSDSLFDEGFGDAFGDAGDDSDFVDDDFESDIPRLDLGIEGLDEMIQGGVPRKHLLVVIGSAGTGKTTFGLQFLHHGLQNGENSVFITLEQSHEAIMATANEWGWDFEHYEQEGRLAVVDLDPVEMANSLDNIQAELPELIKDFGADRLVLDSVSLLEMMYDNQAKRRTEVFDFTRALKKAGVTTFLTSEASESNPYASRHGIIEYLTDAVFVLQYVRGETQETRLAVEIQKIRNANHSREQKPYEMTDEGISVYQQANIF